MSKLTNSANIGIISPTVGTKMLQWFITMDAINVVSLKDNSGLVSIISGCNVMYGNESSHGNV